MCSAPFTLGRPCKTYRMFLHVVEAGNFQVWCGCPNKDQWTKREPSSWEQQNTGAPPLTDFTQRPAYIQAKFWVHWTTEGEYVAGSTWPI
jgi:hypothetical protein